MEKDGEMKGWRGKRRKTKTRQVEASFTDDRRQRADRRAEESLGRDSDGHRVEDPSERGGEHG